MPAMFADALAAAERAFADGDRPAGLRLLYAAIFTATRPEQLRRIAALADAPPDGPLPTTLFEP
jgi:hypothetical protein